MELSLKVGKCSVHVELAKKDVILIGENSLHFIFQNELHFLLTKNDFAGLAKVIERENVFENRPGISGRFENVFFGEGMFFP